MVVLSIKINYNVRTSGMKGKQPVSDGIDLYFSFYMYLLVTKGNETLSK